MTSVTTAGHEPAGPAWRPLPRRWGWPDLLALSVWTAAVVVLFGKAALLQEALFYFDITEINYPYRDFLAREFGAGRFSRWMPGLYCGLPLFSESQAGYLHPLKLLYLVLTTWKAFNLDTILSVWLIGAGTYGWLRRHVGTSGALGGAVLFGLNGFVWSHVIHTSMINALVSVPLVFWGLEATWTSGRFRGMGLAALALACQVFAGHLQDTILTSLALGLYGLWRATQETERAWRGFVLGTTAGVVLLGALIAAVQIVPSKELIDRSPRAHGLSWDDLTFGSWSPELLPTFLVREAYGTRARNTDWMDGFYPYQEMDVYLGLLGLGLAVVGGTAYRDRWVGCWVLLGSLGLFFMLGRFNVVFDLMPKLPIIGSGRIPVRYHLWVALAVSALAAVGIDRLAQPGVVRLRGMVLAWLILLALSVPILAWVYAPVWSEPQRWTTPSHRQRYNALALEVALGAVRSFGLAGLGYVVASAAARTVDPGRRSLLAGVLPVLLLLDLMHAHGVEVPTIDPRYWTEPPPTAARLRADPTCVRIFGLGYYSAGEPGYAVSRVDFFSARDTLAWSLAPVWGLKSSGRITPIVPTRMVRYDEAANEAGVRFDIESVTHVLSGTPGVAGRFADQTKVGSAYILRNDRALPRARVLGRPLYVADERAAERALLALGLQARDRIIVEDPSRPLPPDAAGRGTATIVRDEPERVEVEVTVAGASPAYLFLADSFDPGWSATVDGRETPIRPAQVAFRAVLVDPGTHRVVFRYTPAGFRTGLALSGSGALLALAAWLVPWPRSRLGAEHGPSRWASGWPLLAWLVLACLMAASTVSIGPDGRVGIQDRWNIAFHRFTWGAKIEAIQPPRREID